MALSSSNVSKVSVLAIVLCAATSDWAEETASSPNAWTELRAKIEEREKTIKSFDIRFEERMPDKVVNWIVLKKGNRQIRVEHEGKLLSPIDQKPYLAKTINVSNGNVHKTFCPNLGNLYPGGYVTKEDRTSFYSHVALQPIAFRYRMVEWMAADCPTRSNDKISVRTGTLDGKACVIAWWSWTKPAVVFPDGKLGKPTINVREVHLDPTREMIPLRVTAMVNGSFSTHLQWDLEYSVADAGFVLSGWKFDATNREGRIRHAKSVKVLQWKVNPSIDDSAFDIQFPVGTYIEDRVAGENYILKENSRKRRVTAKDWSGATYETLLHTEPSN